MAIVKINNLGVTDGTLVNADVNASAAIALSKLATDPSNASNLASGTIPTARLGSGTASSSTVLYGDQTYKAEPGGGITHASSWRLHTGFTGAANPIASNWEEFDMYQNVSATALLGSSMTESSGVFTFPSTGFYYIWFQATFNEGSNLIKQNRANIKVTLDNSNWKQGSTAMSNLPSESYTSTWIGLSLLLDVTSTTNVKCRFEVEDDGEDVQDVLGSTGENRTYATFVRLGDT